MTITGANRDAIERVRWLHQEAITRVVTDDEWSAAESAARSAAWSAAESAAWSAARSAAWSAARSAAWSAAESALTPTTKALQASALKLVERMCAVGREAAK